MRALSVNMGVAKIVALLGTSAAIVGVVVAACLPDPERPPTGGPASAVPCDGGGPGNFPPANCDPTPNMCPAAADPTCVIDSKCGSTSTCLPMADNASNPKKTFDLRLRKLFVTAPSALVQPTIQNNIVGNGVNMNAPQCGERGIGSFNWLVRIDKAAGTLTTGGAPPSSDVFGAGYCFYQANVNGLKVGPVVAPMHFTNDTDFSTDPVDLLNVPIFTDPTDLTSVVILPLRKFKIGSGKISTDGNCIGQFNPLAVTGAKCYDEDVDNCARWHTDATIGGFITLEDADTVDVALLSESLCVLLTGAAKDANGKCPRTAGKITPQGDYCSTSQTAGDCRDAFWMSATFAASAIHINDGAGTVGCGVEVLETDAGTDAGTSDAALDADTSDASDQ